MDAITEIKRKIGQTDPNPKDGRILWSDVEPDLRWLARVAEAAVDVMDTEVYEADADCPCDWCVARRRLRDLLEER